MSEDARSLGTLAAAVAPDYMQSAAAAPSEALRSSNAGSWTGMTGCKQGRQQILVQEIALCFSLLLGVYSGQTLEVFLIFPGRQVHVSQAAEGILYYSRKSPQCNTCQGGGWQN
ncbi:hypothetical protein QBC32DRAFT_323939 [Pseudoneurospora amorphoporcata]|uniref:Uncharacterized protein n=1 Tax=Pseudoneurospora amorphoporcata TaxID=241081 RepID=A0AAN6SG14_9PEZI|nr:hypothetical protein QBC32DRAFT_323939 [Pseudoneurospora amorphoporcata]